MPETYSESDFSTNVCAVWKKNIEKKIFSVFKSFSATAAVVGECGGKWNLTVQLGRGRGKTPKPDFVFREI